jgi:hypothetical protein
VEIINRISSLFRIPRSTAGISEEVKAALEKAIHKKDAGRYSEALHIVDEIIREDPDIPLALIVKSVILWEGFKDSYTAKLGLQRVKQLVPRKKDKLNRMASELMEKIERPYLSKIDGKPD